MILTKQSRETAFLNLYEDTANDSIRYLYMHYYDANHNVPKFFKIPYSSMGYGYGAGFSDSFDAYGIISTKVKKQNGDFNVVQYGDKKTIFYSFTMDSRFNMKLNYIYIMFRHSNNYGIEPENIELTRQCGQKCLS